LVRIRQFGDEVVIKLLSGKGNSPSKKIEFEELVVIKKVNPELATIEAKVTQAAHDLSESCNLFYCPKVLDYDPQSGTLKLERIEGIIPLADYLNKTGVGIKIIKKVGRTLACVHSRLEVPDDIKRFVPSDWQVSDNDCVILHGDFNLINVCYKEDTDQIVILDWATAPAFKFTGTVGPRYLDLVHFIRSLLLQQRRFTQAIKLFRRRTNAFLQAYQDELGRPIDLSVLGEFICRVNTAILRKQWRRKMLISLAQTLVGEVILRNLANQWTKKQHLLPSQKNVAVKVS